LSRQHHQCVAAAWLATGGLNILVAPSPQEAITPTAGWRDEIFQQHLPEVLQALRCGGEGLYAQDPLRDEAPIYVDFHSRDRRYRRV
jgi:hypothetical protein